MGGSAGVEFEVAKVLGGSVLGGGSQQAFDGLDGHSRAGAGGGLDGFGRRLGVAGGGFRVLGQIVVDGEGG